MKESFTSIQLESSAPKLCSLRRISPETDGNFNTDDGSGGKNPPKCELKDALGLSGAFYKGDGSGWFWMTGQSVLLSRWSPGPIR